MSKLETITIDTPSGSNTMQIGSTNTATINLGVSGDTINVPAGVTIANAGTATGFGGANTPAFEAFLSGSDQDIGDSVNTRVAFNSEAFDTDNAYDNSTNYRFTPTVAGKYLVYGKIRLQSGADTQLKTSSVAIYKNGSAYSKSQALFWNSYIRMHSPTTAYVIDMNGTSDYLELFGYIDVTSGTPDGAIGTASDRETNFGAYRIGS